MVILWHAWSACSISNCTKDSYKRPEASYESKYCWKIKKSFWEYSKKVNMCVNLNAGNSSMKYSNLQWLKPVSCSSLILVDVLDSVTNCMDGGYFQYPEVGPAILKTIIYNLATQIINNIMYSGSIRFQSWFLKRVYESSSFVSFSIKIDTNKFYTPILGTFQL